MSSGTVGVKLAPLWYRAPHEQSPTAKVKSLKASEHLLPGSEVLAPFTLSVQSGNILPFCRLAVLYIRYGHGKGEQSSLAYLPVVTELKRFLFTAGGPQDRVARV